LDVGGVAAHIQPELIPIFSIAKIVKINQFSLPMHVSRTVFARLNCMLKQMMSEINPMNEEANRYHAYLLRLWRAQYQGEWQWRASLESPHSGERHSFANLEQLFVYLKERCEIKEKTNSETAHFTRRSNHEG
jgi:hypothetical protein